ncbi:MAG: heavy-metal-associated domain-containing protein [Bacteroidales bacterium]|nr:heavy-metal-associated domain-containing protein [Bacteroidales bacterium]
MKKLMVAVVVLLLSGASVYAQSCCSSKVKTEVEKKGCCCGQKKIVEAASAVEENVKYVVFKADQMRCGGCAGKVTKTLKANEGVKDVNITLEDKHVKVAYDPEKTDVKGLLKEFAKIEYKVEVLEQ